MGRFQKNKQEWGVFGSKTLFATDVIAAMLVTIAVRIRKVLTLGFNAWIFLCKKLICFFLYLFYCYFRKAFLQKQSVNASFLTSSCGLIVSKLNQSVHAFMIYTVTKNISFIVCHPTWPPGCFSFESLGNGCKPEIAAIL